MTRKEIFVGRKAELKQFDEVLRSPEGQAVLVVGQQGMGKTMLVNKMAELALAHPDLQCGCVRYEVTRTDSVDSVMELMLDHAYEAARVKEKSLERTPRRLEQWRALLNVIKIGDLWMSLWRDPKRNTRDQFLERLELISNRMPENRRAIFIIDPEKYMQKESDQAWAIVIRQLPPKIKFLFAQRPDDALATSPEFKGLKNAVRIPHADLDVLDEPAIEQLLESRAPELPYAIDKLRDALSRYQGHPYAIVAALDLIQNGVAIEDLPADPTPQAIAGAQWRQVCDHSPKAIRLFKAYAILEVAVPEEVIEAVSELDSDTHQHLLAHRYLAGLLRKEADGRRIYHALLADHIRGQTPQDEAKEYHRRAIAEYRRRLTAHEKPDALAALRLPEHVLEAEGPTQAVRDSVNQCYGALVNLGLLHAALLMSQRALALVSRGSADQAVILGDMGLIHRRLGNINEAERLHRAALEINQRLGRLHGAAANYDNLGTIYQARGDLEQAERMHRASLQLSQRLGRAEGTANAYGNLGLVFWKRHDLDEAERLHRKCLQLNVQLGLLEGAAKAYANVAAVCWARGDLEQAERLLAQALQINRRLGRLEGMAKDSSNLGLVRAERGELAAAEALLASALDIYRQLEAPAEVANTYSNLAALHNERGQRAAARELWTKARNLYAKIGMKLELEKVQAWLDDLPESEAKSEE